VSNIPDDLQYTSEHEYVARTGDPAVVRIGITDYAQGELGDVVYVNLPKPGQRLSSRSTPRSTATPPSSIAIRTATGG
jgi:glycine cleavage system H protein